MQFYAEAQSWVTVMSSFQTLGIHCLVYESVLVWELFALFDNDSLYDDSVPVKMKAGSAKEEQDNHKCSMQSIHHPSIF